MIWKLIVIMLHTIKTCLYSTTHDRSSCSCCTWSQITPNLLMLQGCTSEKISRLAASNTTFEDDWEDWDKPERDSPPGNMNNTLPEH